MRIDGLAFVFEEFHKIKAGMCPGCGQKLLPRGTRTHEMTCSDACHNAWMDRLVAELGPTKVLTLHETGKRYVVPTRIILDRGITAADLPSYPEAPAES